MIKKQKKGFALFNKEHRRKIASMGGRSQGKEVNSGNFANNRKRAALAGKKGGLAKHSL